MPPSPAAARPAPVYAGKHRYSLKTSLLVLAALCVLPAAIVNAWLLYNQFELKRNQAEQSTLLLARQVAADLENELSAIESALKVLATAPELLTDDLPGFHRRAREALVAGTVYNYILTDRLGRQVLNTLVPPGQPLPATGTPAQFDRVFTDGTTVLTDLFIGPVTQRHALAMGVPVRRQGEVVYSLNIGLAPERLNALLARQALPEGWLIAILDGTGTIAGRSRDAQRFVGEPAVPALRAALAAAPESQLRLPTKEGYMSYSAVKRSARWGWGVAVGVQEDTLHAAIGPLVWRVAGITVLVLGSGLLLALGLARRVLATVHDINAAAKALSTGEAVAIPEVQFREAEAVGEALRQAAQAMRQVTFAAQHDPLTQLANRAMFTEIAQRQLAASLRSGQPLALVAIDLDHFKDVNDSQGHAVGDAVLVEAGRRIELAVRQSDTVARLGGDEFMVLLGATDPAHARTTAERIVEALSQPYPMTPCPVSASAGVALHPAHGATLQALVAAADRALYQAKAQGRHCARMAAADSVSSTPSVA